MFKYSKFESKTVFFLFSILIGLTLFNLSIAKRKSRDSQRRADVNSIFNSVSNYQKEFGFFPPSSDDGRILACRDENYSPPPKDLTESDRQNYFFSTLTPCDWGKDSLRDLDDLEYEPYLKVIPQDPKYKEAVNYYYISNKRRFQMFAYLEGGKLEEGYNEGVVERGLRCGEKICNFGKAFADEDITLTLEKIEEELMKKANQNQ